MLVTLIALQALALIVLIVLLLRRAAPAQESADPRLAQLLIADLPTQITRLDARFDSLDTHLRAQLAEQRAEAESRSAALRSELITNLTTLSSTLSTSLDKARHENDSAAERLRSRVQDGLQQLTASNEKKLEEMRVTVDEKLHATLQTRLTESFGQVTDQLTKVHAGLGEMTKLSAGVDDLSRIFTNVKSRGQFAEAMLDNLLKQMLAPSQFVRNAQVRPDTQEVVEFAVRFPGLNGEVLLPIDSKFPRESADRLESAYESGSAAEIAAARKVFENAIRTEAKRICSKYINEPVTTPNAIMFLPTEGLYAEVMRRDGLHDDIQQNCHVMIAGPSNLSAVLTSFQMVFALVNLQKKGGEVWNVLASARSEFSKFGVLMDKMDKQVGTVQNTIREIGTRTRAINKTLKDVSKDDADLELPTSSPGAFDGLLPMLAASDDE
jgi:DNA recombination protein RmuC